MGVDLRCGIYAGSEEVLAEQPDVVIVATGGMPDTEWLEGAQYCETPWDILGATTTQTGDILVYDGTGRHDAPSTALHLAGQGATVRYVTPDDSLSQEVEYSTRAIYRKAFKEQNIAFTTEYRLISLRKNNRIIGTFRHELTGDILEIEADRFVVEQGTYPLDEVFTELRDLSKTMVSLISALCSKSERNQRETATAAFNYIVSAMPSQAGMCMPQSTTRCVFV